MRPRAGGVLGVGLWVLLLSCAGLRWVGLVDVWAMPVVVGYAALLHSFLCAGVVISTSGRLGGRGAGAIACPYATDFLGHGAGGIEILSFLRFCHLGRGHCSNPGAAQGSIVQMLLESNGVGGSGATMDGGRRSVRRSGPLSRCAVVPVRTERLRNVG